MPNQNTRNNDLLVGEEHLHFTAQSLQHEQEKAVGDWQGIQDIKRLCQKEQLAENRNPDDYPWTVKWKDENGQ